MYISVDSTTYVLWCVASGVEGREPCWLAVRLMFVLLLDQDESCAAELRLDSTSVRYP